MREVAIQGRGIYTSNACVDVYHEVNRDRGDLGGLDTDVSLVVLPATTGPCVGANKESALAATVIVLGRAQVAVDEVEE